jgi:Golgi phosphoprotein 3 GPP34
METGSTLAEQLLLIALDPSPGKPMARPPMGLSYCLAGGVVMDLLLAHGSSLVDGTVLRHPQGTSLLYCKVKPGPDTGDPVLDEALVMIRGDSKPREIGHWVRKLAGLSMNLQAKLLERLTEQRILEQRDVRKLGFRLTRYTIVDPAPREKAVAMLRSALLGAAAPDPRTAALIVLANAYGGLVGSVVEKPERAAAIRRAKELADAAALPWAMDSALREVQVAVWEKLHDGGSAG